MEQVRGAQHLLYLADSMIRVLDEIIKKKKVDQNVTKQKGLLSSANGFFEKAISRTGINNKEFYVAIAVFQRMGGDRRDSSFEDYLRNLQTSFKYLKRGQSLKHRQIVELEALKSFFSDFHRVVESEYSKMMRLSHAHLTGDD